VKRQIKTLFHHGPYHMVVGLTTTCVNQYISPLTLWLSVRDHLQNMDCLTLHFKVRTVSINHCRLHSDCNCRFGLVYGVKSIHLIGWILSMWPSLFGGTDWDADIDRCYQSIHGFWTGLYQHIKLQFLLGFLIPWKVD
jgi:hypothetical protein